jgi:hypothetical protein
LHFAKKKHALSLLKKYPEIPPLNSLTKRDLAKNEHFKS